MIKQALDYDVTSWFIIRLKMDYTVKQLADLAGVSVRTLHYYDQSGLLKPESYSTSGYRRYSETSVVRLQQIMFFRELDFSLEEIKKMCPNRTSTCLKR
jgi:DNA-binding transcriptional MerR regulator